MDIQTLLMLSCTVFGASLLQAATGIGYGVIAGPILLIVLNGSEAFEISTLHNLIIAVVLFPVVRNMVNTHLLSFLIVGGSLGILTGFLFQNLFSVWVLKVFSAVMVSFVATSLALDMRHTEQVDRSDSQPAKEISVVGFLSGIMGGMLAMPGPIAATWMSVRGYSKQETRSTILAFFIFAYGSNVLLYWSTYGFSNDVLKLTLTLAAPLALGIFIGNTISKHVSEVMFRKVLLAVLLATVASLVADWIVWTLVAHVVASPG